MVFFFGFSLKSQNNNLKRECTVKTTAVVSDISDLSDSHDKRYQPEFTYTYQGKEYIKNSDITSADPKVKVGENVEFYIDPNNAYKYYCPKELEHSERPFMIFGFILLVVTLINIKRYIYIRKNYYF